MRKMRSQRRRQNLKLRRRQVQSGELAKTVATRKRRLKMMTLRRKTRRLSMKSQEKRSRLQRL